MEEIKDGMKNNMELRRVPVASLCAAWQISGRECHKSNK
jgi:hypothetical protein